MAYLPRLHSVPLIRRVLVGAVSGVETALGVTGQLTVRVLMLPQGLLVVVDALVWSLTQVAQTPTVYVREVGQQLHNQLLSQHRGNVSPLVVRVALVEVVQARVVLVWYVRTV
jgi:hypothetical protein